MSNQLEVRPMQQVCGPHWGGKTSDPAALGLYFIGTMTHWFSGHSRYSHGMWPLPGW
jgi:hypothetical protein